MAVVPASAEEAMTVLRQEIAATPGLAPAMVARTLKAAGANASSVAGPVTQAAIQGLGSGASSKQIAAIVYSAVHTAPDSALQIVRAAVSVAPKSAPGIAAAAALAVPNPWKEVHYQHGPQPGVGAPQAAPIVAKERDFKSERDYKSPVDGSQSPLPVQDPNPPADLVGDPMTLAEAIVQAAVDAGGDPGATQSAVDTALFGDPGALFNQVSGSKSISGVGDAGDSNYANEPHLPDPSVVSP
ncbi:hypothetical protein CfE428DRAFT_2772 [Chthoniobacter flavus Ellin428]|uniref:Uncharacterized protein n=1 Tax=Chthoniobacter flavus Ellin428 TaxID=497964 RepID=B4D1I4_9BACT|nr:hypothetical protein [Chthoniobacter flavus]EDY19596.1 hypothetical protein CfE428DRAFT_2772 [Chthoniobacter flavus Ellin428]TCO92836.1 hypothetical protein EV701_105113 [Chthoniobacter flavus]